MPSKSSAPATLLIAAVCAVVIGATCIEAQEVTGTLRGLVRDSTVDAPLVDAAVFLWNTPYRTVTDSLGRYRIAGVPPGTYTVLFFHTRLGELGVSAGPRQVTVRAGAETEVNLATPSRFTIAASQCLLESGDPDAGAAAGWVADARSGMALPGATVTLAWTASGEKLPRRVQVRTDADGWYRVCGLPTETPIVEGATFLDRSGLRREITLRRGSGTEASILLWRLDPAHISGHLVDGVSGRAVPAAEVWLRGTSFHGMTDGQGHFAFSGVPPGTYMLMTDHLTYGAKMDTLEVGSGQRLNVEMKVDTRAIEIAPLTVTVDAARLPKRVAGGTVVTRADIDKVAFQARDIGDVVRAQKISGVIVQRGPRGVCIGYMPAQARMMFRQGCVPMTVFINDVRASNPLLALDIPPDVIERIVFYRPVEAGVLFGLGSMNGVLVVYTRRR